MEKPAAVRRANAELGSRCEGTADVADAVKPIAWNFEGDKNPAGTKDAEGFGEHLILELRGFEVVKNEDGER